MFINILANKFCPLLGYHKSQGGCVNWYERAKKLAKSQQIQYKEIALVLDVTQGAIGH